MSTKRWKKSTRKPCTKKEEKEVLEHLRKIGQYVEWLKTLPESEAVKHQIENSEACAAGWRARYKDLVGR